MDRTADGDEPRDVRRTWLSRRALLLHVTIVIVLPTFLGLFWWQVQRVRQGNTLSWAYVFEWPFFAGYAVYLWWRLVHEQPELAGARDEGAAPRAAANPAPSTAVAAAPAAAGSSEEDREMAAYNRYLAELNASGRQKRW